MNITRVHLDDMPELTPEKDSREQLRNTIRLSDKHRLEHYFIVDLDTHHFKNRTVRRGSRHNAAHQMPSQPFL